jgi:hypothetical protein
MRTLGCGRSNKGLKLLVLKYLHRDITEQGELSSHEIVRFEKPALREFEKSLLKRCPIATAPVMTGL